MTQYSKKYADGHQKDPRWQKVRMKIGRKKFTPRPSRHAAERLKRKQQVSP